MNKIRRLLAFVLCLCLSFPAVAFAVEDDGAAKDSGEGNPAAAAEGGETGNITEEAKPAADSENTVYIYNEEDLRILAENCSLDTWSMDKTVVLEADIVLGETASEFLPIPVFCGTFDGGGHSIGGFTMTGSIAGAGLFGTVGEGAVIRQLKVIGQVSPSGDADTIGGLAGINHGKLVNCTFEGAVQGNATVGGIVGLNGETGQVAGCSFSGTLTGEHYVGGIAGQNFGSIFRCTNNGSINTIATPVKTELSDIGFDNLLSMENVPAGTDIGGIAGFSRGHLEYCKNTGSIGYEHMGYNVGGIAGRQSGYLKQCENSGTVRGRKDIGGIAGQMEPRVTLKYTEGILGRISSEVSSLQDKMDRAVTNAESVSDSLSASVDSVLSGIETVRNSTGDLSDAAVGWGDNGINELNDATDKLSGAVKDMEPVMDAASQSLADARKTIEGLKEADGTAKEKLETTVDAMETVFSSMQQTTKQAGDIAGRLVKEPVGNITPFGEEVQEEGNALEEAAAHLHDSASAFQATAASSSDILLGDLHTINTQLEEITDLMEEGMEEIEEKELGNFFDDVSDEGISDALSDGLILHAENTGTVEGDINTAGIVGVIGIEYDFDPEDDLNKEGSRTLDFRYEVFAMIEGCKNEGEVSAKKDCAGGIVGNLELGCIRDCESYAKITSASGDYVGGIAGKNNAVIRDCFGKCTLSGRRYVGGITGMGKEDSTVSGCYAMAEITDSEQYCGAISGTETGEFLGNYFVSDELAGLGRISLGKKAEPVSFEALHDVEGMPGEMTGFTLRFVADGEELKRENFAYGDSFGEEVFPEIPEKEGCYAVWDTEDLTSLHFDKTVTAVYSRYVMALLSADVRDSGKAIFLVDGDFDEEAKLSVSMVETGALKEAGVKDITGEILEQWHLEIPDDGASAHTVRYLPVEEGIGSPEIYIRQDDGYKRVEYADFGSYLTFEVKGQEADIAVASRASSGWVKLVAAAGIVLVSLALLLFLIKGIAKRKNKRKTIPENREKKKSWALYSVFGAVLLCIVLFALFFGGKIKSGMDAYELLHDFSMQQEYAMDVTVDTTLEEDMAHADIRIFGTKEEGKRIACIQNKGISLYYADNAVILENGKAYRVDDLLPDYSKLLDEAAAVYQGAKFTTAKQDGITSCQIEAEGENAERLLKILMPSSSEYLSDTHRLDIELRAEGEKLLSVKFASEGSLIDSGHTPYTVSAELKPMEIAEEITIPEQVKETVCSGEAIGQENISEDLFRLFTAWAGLRYQESNAARILLAAECGPISLKDEMKFEQKTEEGQKISCVRKNSLAVYFSDNAVCNKDGHSLSAEENVMADSAKLLDFIYQIGLNGEFDCMDTGNGTYLYTLSLDEEAMKTVAYAMVPEMAGMDAVLASGSVQITVEKEEITNIRVDCGGNVDILLDEMPVNLSLEMIFMDGAGFAVPEAVKEMLLK